MESIEAQVTLHIKDDLDQDALFAKARELDEVAGNDPLPSTYTFSQAIQIIWHNEPGWLHEHVLDGWTMDRTAEDGGWHDVWPSFH